MENNNLPAVEATAIPARDCANCGQPAMEGDHPASLCSDCREQFTRLNIPGWIKLFAGGIGVVLLFSLFTLPKSVGLGIRLERGERAARERKYVTAGRELKEFLDKVPDNVEARGYLMISAFYSQDFPTFTSAFKQLEHVNIEDKALFAQLDQVITKAGGYVSNDSFENFRTAHPALSLAPDSAWNRYLQHNPQDNFAHMEYASLLFDRKAYARCDSLLLSILGSDNEYFGALMMEASLKRESGDLDGALAYNDRILATNHESTYGLSSKARTLLRQKKDKMALDLALKSYGMNNRNPYALASLILAYHFNNQVTERDALIGKAPSAVADSSDKATIKYALDVIGKTEKFDRN